MSLLPLLSLLLAPPQDHGTASEAPRALHLPAGGAEVELLDFGGRPMVEISIGDNEPLRVLVDTGSTLGLLLGPGLCERLGLERAGTTDVGGGEAVGRYLASELRIGDASFEGVPVTELPFLGGMQGVSGVLGFPCFGTCSVTFDFAAKRFRLSSERLEAGADTVSFRVDEQMGFGVVVDVDVGGVSVPAHLDTGSPGVAMFSNVAREGIHLTEAPRAAGTASTPMGNAEVTSAHLAGDLRLGAILHPAPVLRFADLPQIAGRNLGNLGSGFFRNASLTLDPRSRLLRITTGAGGKEKTAAAASATGSRPLGVQLEQRNDGDRTSFLVANVLPGTAAEKAGLRAGDELLEVDGKAMSQDAMREALRGTAPVALTVERDGKRLTLQAFADAH